MCSPSELQLLLAFPQSKAIQDKKLIQKLLTEQRHGECLTHTTTRYSECKFNFSSFSLNTVQPCSVLRTKCSQKTIFFQEKILIFLHPKKTVPDQIWPEDLQRRFATKIYYIGTIKITGMVTKHVMVNKHQKNDFIDSKHQKNDCLGSKPTLSISQYPTVGVYCTKYITRSTGCTRKKGQQLRISKYDIHKMISSKAVC